MPGQWRDSDRHDRLPPNWDHLTKRVLRRDGHQCTWLENGERCTARATDVDHIVNDDNHELDNLRSLCGPHHRRKSAAEGVAARNLHLRKRPQRPHPGLRGGG